MHQIDGKQYTAQVIAKEDFEKVVSDYREEGLSDDVITAIETVVCLAPEQTEFYQVKYLEALLNEVAAEMD